MPRADWLTLLCFVNVKVSVLQQLADDRLDVFADIAGLRQRCTVTYGKRDVETSRQDLREESLPCTSSNADISVTWPEPDQQRSHIPTLPQPCWVMGFVQISKSSLGDREEM